MTPLITAQNISIAFRKRKVLRQVSLSIQPGEAVAIIGPNGAGKSTLMKILARVLSPDTGRVLLQGDPLKKLPRKSIARRLTTVPQSSPQAFDYGLLDFVLMGFYARSSRFALPSPDELHQARQALDTMGLAHLEDATVSHLSGGELQRALMARAILTAAPLWLLDEPTANLDMHHQVALLKVMKDHVHSGGAALAILHDLALVHRFFDRVLVLKDGHFVAHGRPDDVLTPELVSHTFGIDMDRGKIHGEMVWVVT